MSTEFPISQTPNLFLKIGSEDVGDMFLKFEWKSFTNGGYIIRAKLHDAVWSKLRDIATQFYLDKGRKEPTPVTYELSWPGVNGDNRATGKHLAYMTELEARNLGAESGGYLEFVAVDPPSFWLNCGDSSGKVYTGKVGGNDGVIHQCVKDYFKEGDVVVSDTTDFDKNQWWMNRQDPKTFIASLLDWSSGATIQKTNWIVSSDDKELWIKEQAARESIFYGTFSMNVGASEGHDILSVEFLAENLLSIIQKQLITHGLSAVSGRYFDKITDTPPHTGTENQCIVHVHDENTPAKKKTAIDRTKGFSKPTIFSGAEGPPHECSTSIASIPEPNGQEIGLKYDEYIDGRARKQFLDMLCMVMKIKIRCAGIAKPTLSKSHYLGVSKLKILWDDAAKSREYFLAGDWMVFGFHHIVTRGHWYTDIYCFRIDYDAVAQAV